MSSLFDSTIGKHPILKIQHVMLMMMMMKMMMKMIILSKIGWPSVGGGGTSANNATGSLTHSRTHARTHAMQ